MLTPTFGKRCGKKGIITWHPSHRPAPEYQDRYGDPHHWRVRLNNLADQACKEAAAVSWRQHAAQVAQIDELAEEISHFLAGRAWTMLAGKEAPPLDLKPRKAPRASLPKKAKAQQPTAPRPPQQQNRPGPDGGLNKKQRLLELLMASEHIHGHRFAWSHTNPIKCGVCTLFIQQTHPPEIFSRLEAQPCAHKPLPDIGHFGLHPSHSFYCMGAVLLCTKCYAVHKPGQLTPTMATRDPCEGASRAHAKRRSLWVQKYLKETTAPVTLFAAGGRASQTFEVSRAEPTPDSPAQSRPIGEPVASSQAEPKTGCGLHTWMTAEKANTQGTSAARSKNTSAMVQGSSHPSARVPLVSAPQAGSLTGPQCKPRWPRLLSRQAALPPRPSLSPNLKRPLHLPHSRNSCNSLRPKLAKQPRHPPRAGLPHLSFPQRRTCFLSPRHPASRVSAAMAEEGSRPARLKGKGRSEEGYGPGVGKGKARAPSQGRSKGKAKTKGGGKDTSRTQGQGSGKGSPPAPSAVQLDPLLEAR